MLYVNDWLVMPAVVLPSSFSSRCCFWTFSLVPPTPNHPPSLNHPLSLYISWGRKLRPNFFLCRQPGCICNAHCISIVGDYRPRERLFAQGRVRVGRNCALGYQYFTGKHCLNDASPTSNNSAVLQGKGLTRYNHLIQKILSAG